LIVDDVLLGSVKKEHADLLSPFELYTVVVRAPLVLELFGLAKSIMGRPPNYARPIVAHEDVHRKLARLIPLIFNEVTPLQ
jgi:hypothetical protein